MSGQRLFLFSIAKSLFNHILEVTKDVFSFHSEYSSILRSILIVRDYRYQMRNKIYSSEFDFFLFYSWPLLNGFCTDYFVVDISFSGIYQ